MEFTTIRKSTINVGLFDDLQKAESNITVSQDQLEKAKDENFAIYTEESLHDLKEHCYGIVEKGDDATEEELDSLRKALDEVQNLQRGEVEEDGILVPFYYRAK